VTTRSLGPLFWLGIRKKTKIKRSVVKEIYRDVVYWTNGGVSHYPLIIDFEHWQKYIDAHTEGSE